MHFGSRLVDAVSWWVPGLNPLFFVNDALPPDRERMTLAHELAHMVMHDSIRPEMEDEANRFASEFLMPSADIAHSLSVKSLHDLARLKPYWRVSMAALLKKAETLGKVDPGRARYLWVQLSKHGYRTREPAELDPPREQPMLLQELIDLHASSLGFTVGQLAEMLALDEHEMLALYDVRHITHRGRRKGLRSLTSV